MQASMERCKNQVNPRHFIPQKHFNSARKRERDKESEN